MLKLAEYIKSIVPGVVSENVFTFTIRGITYYVVCFEVKMDTENVSLCFTANAENNIYLSVTDGDAQKISMVLAFFLDYEINEGILDVGHTFKPEDEYLLAHGREGVVFLPPRVLPLLRDLPSTININDSEQKILLAVFMDGKEFEVKDNQGLDSLLTYFSETNKDIIRLEARNH